MICTILLQLPPFPILKVLIHKFPELHIPIASELLAVALNLPVSVYAAYEAETPGDIHGLVYGFPGRVILSHLTLRGWSSIKHRGQGDGDAVTTDEEGG